MAMDKLDQLLALNQKTGFSEHGESAAGNEGAQAPEVNSKLGAKTAKRVSGSKKGSVDASFPWMTIEKGNKKNFLMVMPAEMKLLLDHLGQTTYGESMTSICLKGIRNELIRMSKERDLPIPKSMLEKD